MSATCSLVSAATGLRAETITTISAAAAGTVIQTQMYATWVQIVRGGDSPDLLVADSNFWQYYNLSLTSNQRFTDPKMAELGFHNIMFQNAPVILDGGKGGACPANHMYFLNTDYISFCSHKNRNFTSLGGKRFSTNQDASVQLIAWAGNMTLSNGSLQAVLKN